MRVASILAFVLVTLLSAGAEGQSAPFKVGPWRGSAVAADGGFAFCGMTALYGQKGAPVALTIGLDRKSGWMVAVSSDQFKLPVGAIKAGLAFDDEAPIDVQGDVKNPAMMSFRFDTTTIIDGHVDAKKLVLVFRDIALPFILPNYAEALGALRNCVEANTLLAGAPDSAEAGPAAPQATETTTTMATTRPESGSGSSAADLPLAAAYADAPKPDSRLYSQLIAPLFIGFVGSVLIVILGGSAIFSVSRRRRLSRYSALWSRECRLAGGPAVEAATLRGPRVLQRQTDAAAA